MASQLDTMRAFLRGLVAAIPQLPGELGRAWQTLAGDMMQERGALDVALLLAVFVALGFGLEWLFWWATTGFRQRMIAVGLDTVRERLQAVGRRFAYGIGVVLAFALGSIGGFLLFDWPRVLKEVVLAYLLVFLAIRLVLVLGRILLAPGAERFRVVPMATASARFWFVWSTVLIGWFAFVNITLDVLTLLGASEPARLSGRARLRRRPGGAHPVRGVASSGAGKRPAGETQPARRHLAAFGLCRGRLAAAVHGLGGALLCRRHPAAAADRDPRRAPRGQSRAAPGRGRGGRRRPSLTAVTLERGLRAALLIGGAYLIAWTLGLDFGMLTAQDTLAMRLVRGAINVVVIVLLADFAWHLLAAWIDCKLAEASGATQPIWRRPGVRRACARSCRSFATSC